MKEKVVNNLYNFYIEKEIDEVEEEYKRYDPLNEVGMSIHDFI